MHITNLVVKELKLTDARELEPYVTINGVTIVELQAAEGNFRVQLIRDPQEINVKLEEGSKLAAYYNSLYWHELSTAGKISVPSAHFKRSLRVSDGNLNHSGYITTFQKGNVRPKLALSELTQVAKEIAKLHAVNKRFVTREFETSVEENYGNIREYQKKVRKELLEVLQLATTNEVSQFFLNPSAIVQKVGILKQHVEDEKEDGNEHVITHGRLTADTCRFDEHGKLVEITEWENIHLGNPVEDLTNLIVSSADPSIRRSKFMKVFQVYFYTLVDLRPPNYQLNDLKRWYRENLTKAVLSGIEPLLLLLSESSDFELKKEAARRWETSLDDTVDYLTGNYVSDDEQVFFSHKEEEED